MQVVAQQNSMSFSHKIISLSISFLTWLHHVPSHLSWDPWCQFWFHLLLSSLDGLKFFCLLCLLHYRSKNMHLSILLLVCRIQLFNWFILQCLQSFRESSVFLHSFVSPSLSVWGKASMYRTDLRCATHQFSCFWLLPRGRTWAHTADHDQNVF